MKRRLTICSVGVVAAVGVLVVAYYLVVPPRSRRKEKTRVQVASENRDWQALLRYARSGKPDSEEALNALARLRCKEAVPRLLEMLAHPNRRLRQQAVHALAMMREESAVPHLLKLLEAKDPGDRSDAIYALEFFPRWEVVRALAGRLDDEESPPCPTPPGISVTTIPILYQADNALRSMLGLGCMRRLKGKPEIRDFWTKWIKEHQGAPLAEAVVENSRDVEPSRRVAAASALCKFKDPKAVERLIDMLGDPEPEVARAAKDCLRYAARHTFAAFPREGPGSRLPGSQAAWRAWWQKSRAAFKFD